MAEHMAGLAGRDDIMIYALRNVNVPNHVLLDYLDKQLCLQHSVYSVQCRFWTYVHREGQVAYDTRSLASGTNRTSTGRRRKKTNCFR